jgi:hypothetical protein
MLFQWQWLCDQGVRPCEHWVFSDGYVGEFEGAKAMYFVARYLSLMNNYKMWWQYFGTSHGKGMHMYNKFQLHYFMIFAKHI